MAFFERSKEEKEGFEENLLASMNSMYNLALRMTANQEDANDLVQDTSLRAYRFYHKYEKGTNFKGWVLTILRNLFINQYRKKVKEPTKVNYHDLENYIGAPDISGCEEEIFGESLQKSIDALPEDLRTVVTLFYVEGFAYKEIAKIMDCPIGTVMSRLYMARQLLKKKLTVLMKKEV